MPIIADIVDLSASEFLLMLSLASKTGKLSAVYEGRKVLLVIREGTIEYAASPAVRERLGSALVTRGLITQGELNTALQIQRDSSEPQLLGNILVDVGAVSRTALREVIQGQFEEVIRELMDWDGGVMVFECMDIPDLGAIQVNPADVLVGIGIETDHLLVQSLAREEEERAADGGRRPHPSVPPLRTQAETAEAVTKPECAVEHVPPADPEAHEAARSLLREIREMSVALTAEMTLAILGSTSEVAQRGVLFLVHPGCLVGAGGFGPGRDGHQLSGRRLRIPIGPTSLFTAVLESGDPYRGPVETTPGNQPLLDELGEPPPSDALVVPVRAGEQVVAVLYADGGPEGCLLESIDTIGHAVSAVGRALSEDARSGGVEVQPPWGSRRRAIGLAD